MNHWVHADAPREFARIVLEFLTAPWEPPSGFLRMVCRVPSWFRESVLRLKLLAQGGQRSGQFERPVQACNRIV